MTFGDRLPAVRSAFLLLGAFGVLVAARMGAVSAAVALVGLAGILTLGWLLNSSEDRRSRCRLCGGPLANGVAHRETPELRGPDDSAVYFCLSVGRHVIVPLSWSEDIRSTVQTARALLSIAWGRR